MMPGIWPCFVAPTFIAAKASYIFGAGECRLNASDLPLLGATHERHLRCMRPASSVSAQFSARRNPRPSCNINARIQPNTINRIVRSIPVRRWRSPASTKSVILMSPAPCSFCCATRSFLIAASVAIQYASSCSMPRLTFRKIRISVKLFRKWTTRC